MADWLPLPDLLDDQDDGDGRPAATGLEELLALILEHRPEWHDEAACAGADPALFFPERGQDDRRGKALCDTCPVAAQCLSEALRHSEWACPGTWGGTSARERRKLRQAVVVAA